MSTVAIVPFFHFPLRRAPNIHACCKKAPPLYFNYNRRPFSGGPRLRSLEVRAPRPLTLRASTSTDSAAVVETSESSDVVYSETFALKRSVKVEGKITIRLASGKDEETWQLSVGCSIPGKWVLHWGVSYVGDTGSEWDQPPPEMKPPGSIPIKDYAIESPLEKTMVLEGESFYEVKIDFNTNNSIAAINFVLKDEDSGSWYQHRGRDFKVPLVDYLHDDGNVVGAKKGLGVWPGALGQLSNILLKSEGAENKEEYSSSETKPPSQQKGRLEGFYEEHSIVKETLFDNSVTVSVRQCAETAKNLLYMETDLPGDVIVHWGVCKGKDQKWELPEQPYPSETTVFKNKALRTLLQQQEGGKCSSGAFTLDVGLTSFVFALKLNENTWLNNMGNDFYIPLPSSRFLNNELRKSQSGNASVTDEAVSVYTDEIISEIRNLVSDISLEKSRKTKSKEAQESILQEIEKLAAEAYSIFRSSIPSFTEDAVLEAEALKPAVKITSGTGSGFEVVCQGFNWESHKSGRWYKELHEKAAELSSLGFTIVWLPPPTESVSPEGYMPKDLYNLNSRYGNIDELKMLVKRFHEVGIKVLGDVVLNHRCAHYKNQNGVWNIFGGRLNWDDRAVVADDPHFQGRGNKSSGDNFHAAPNIDHSQEFVRKDLKEWLCGIVLALWANFSKKGSFPWSITTFSLSSLSNTLVLGVPLLKAMYGDLGHDLVVQSSVNQFLLWFIVLLILLEMERARSEVLDAKSTNTRDSHIEIEMGKDLEGNTITPVVIKSPPFLLVMKIVWIKLAKNPNFYSCLVGLIWALLSNRWHFKMPEIIEGSILIMSKAGGGVSMFAIGYFIALQERFIACGVGLTLYAMVLRFTVGPALIAVSSLAMGLHGEVLRIAVIQAALPQSVTSFVYAKEYGVHAEVLSTAVIFGTILSLPLLIGYYAILDILR